MAKKKTETLELTPINDWRQETERKKLPSGRVGELKRVNLLTMLQENSEDVPNFLKAQVARGLNGGGNGNPAGNVNDAADLAKSVLFIAKAVFVYPKLVDGEPQADDELFIGDMEMGDLMHSVSYAVGDPEVRKQLENFRQEAAADVEPVPAGE